MIRLPSKYGRNKLIASLVISGFIVVGLYQVSPATVISMTPELEVDLDCMQQNLSGVTYNTATDTLYMVTNEPVVLFETSVLGNCLNAYILNGFDDVEDITYIGENQFLLVEERRHRVSLVELVEAKEGTRRIDLRHSFTIPKKNKPNKGLEGIAYNQITDEIFLVSEFPRRIYRLKHWRNRQSLKIEELNINPPLLQMSDYSSVIVSRNELMILSDRSSRLLKMNRDGNNIKNIKLVDRNKNKLKQAEGVCLHQGKLFVVSEPNHFYVYHLDSQPAQLTGHASHVDHNMN